MKIYAMSDLHLDSTGEKSMDVFGPAWENYEDEIFKNIGNTLNDEDIILVPGDISWALKPEEAILDLEKLDRLPGRKLLGKGNHDYWWGTKAKLNKMELKTIDFIQTNSCLVGNVGVFGTRGWMSRDSEGFTEKDEKIYERELNRLEISLDSLSGESLEKRIVMLHYPPFNFSDKKPNEFVDIMKRYGVDICIYGHLHAEGHKFAVEGSIDGIEFHLVSCDYLRLQPKLIL
jgi:uncharacterized protein